MSLISTDIGNGAVSLKTARIQSAALRIDARGGLRFAPVLTNSPINIPVTIALSRKISEKAMLVDASTPTNAAYAPLPEFLTVKGTLGNPSPSIDKLALASMGAKTLARAAAGLGGNLGGKVAGAAGVLGSLLGTLLRPKLRPPLRLRPMRLLLLRRAAHHPRLQPMRLC